MTVNINITLILIIDANSDDSIGQSIGRHFAKKFNKQCFVSVNITKDVESSTVTIIQKLEEALKDKLQKD